MKNFKFLFVVFSILVFTACNDEKTNENELTAPFQNNLNTQEELLMVSEDKKQLDPMALNKNVAQDENGDMSMTKLYSYLEMSPAQIIKFEAKENNATVIDDSTNVQSATQKMNDNSVMTNEEKFKSVLTAVQFKRYQDWKKNNGS